MKRSIICLIGILLTVTSGNSENTNAQKNEIKTETEESAQRQGMKYFLGEGVPIDIEKGIQFFEVAGTNGDTFSQNFLGQVYLFRTNYAKAFTWFQKAAAQNHPDAQCNLGFMYSSGLGISKNETESFKWYLKSAEGGNALAQYALALDYGKGEGVVKDFKKSFHWAKMSAEQGDASAQGFLGLQFSLGNGVEKSDADAVKWYSRAAEQGHPSAQFQMSRYRTSGRGIAENYVEAYKWMILAVAQNNKDALEFQSVVKGLLTKEQLAEAQSRADSFVPKPEHLESRTLAEILKGEIEKAMNYGGTNKSLISPKDKEKIFNEEVK